MTFISTIVTANENKATALYNGAVFSFFIETQKLIEHNALL